MVMVHRRARQLFCNCVRRNWTTCPHFINLSKKKHSNSLQDEYFRLTSWCKAIFSWSDVSKQAAFVSGNTPPKMSQTGRKAQPPSRLFELSQFLDRNSTRVAGFKIAFTNGRSFIKRLREDVGKRQPRMFRVTLSSPALVYSGAFICER